MATPTPPAPLGSPPPGPVPGRTGALPSPGPTAAGIAAKHTAPPKPGSAPRNLGGRRSIETEAREWFAKQGLVAVPAAQAGLGPLEPLPAPLDPALVKDVVRVLLDGYSEVRVGWLRSKLLPLKLGAELEKDAEKLAAVRPANSRIMVDCSPMVFEQMGLSSQHLPLTAFIGAFATDLLQFGAAMRTFQQMARERAEAERKSQPSEIPKKA